MEFINLFALSKSIAAAKLKQSAKILIRDVDQISDNNFVAYADDKAQSYDVSIKIDNDKNLIDSDCDCEIAGICVHKIAFMIYLGNAQQKPKAVRTKKQTPSEILINSLDANTLKKWVLNLLNKNKDIELLFTNEFSVNNEIYTKPQVKTLINNAIKSVIKNRKSIETAEIKKVLDILDVTLKHVIDYCCSDLTDKDKFEVMLFMIDELFDFDNRMYNSSVKIQRYIEKITKEIVDFVSSINDEIIFQKITDLYFESILNHDISNINEANFKHIQLLYHENINSDIRKKYYAQKIQNFIVNAFFNKIKYNTKIDFYAIQVLFENNLFATTYQYFKPVKYENEYNLSLIDKLIAVNKISEAEQIATSQIAGNYYIEYNLPYWQRLKLIYNSEKDALKLWNILIKTVPLEFNFQDFLYVKDLMRDTDFIKYKSDLLERTRQNLSKNIQAPIFYFNVLADDGNFKKILESISEYTDYDLVFDYKEDLYKEDKILFLLAICKIEDNNMHNIKEFNIEYRQKLVFWIIEKYDDLALKSFLTTYTKRLDSQFLNLIIEKTNI